jgi:hypothetical protein
MIQYAAISFALHDGLDDLVIDSNLKGAYFESQVCLKTFCKGGWRTLV